MSAGGVT